MNGDSDSPIVRPFGLAMLTSFCKVSCFKSSSFAYVYITTINVSIVRARCTIKGYVSCICMEISFPCRSLVQHLNLE